MRKDTDSSFNKNNASQQLSSLFPDLDFETIQLILRSGTILTLKTGDHLFDQGEKHRDVYILINGRLRVIEKKNGKLEILGDIASGETVGELAFFTGDIRMASVLAIRDSVLLEFSPENYHAIVAAHPELSTSIVKLIIQRMKRNTFELNKKNPPKNIALVNLQSEKDLRPWTESFQRYLKDTGISLNIYNQTNSIEKEGLFDTLEEHEGINILVCDEKDKTWSKKCLIYADLIVVATDFEADSELYDFEKEFSIYSNEILNKKVYLLLLHEQNAPLPTNTQGWLIQRPVDLHIHIRKNNDSDSRRFCRIITNKAMGLVLGGGGAKGFAHIGVVKALLEEGIEIDFLGGTSAGALYGIGMSFADFNLKKIHELNEDGVNSRLVSNDFAVPVFSLMTGKKFKRYLKRIFNGRHLEDLWITSYCVSTNYSTSSLHVHIKGELWKQIQASMAIPGIFPPVIINRHLHVDGGVIDNLPVDPMYRYPIGKIIAVSLRSFTDHEVNAKEYPGFWTLFWNKIRFKRNPGFPGIISLIINSLLINSQIRQEETRDKVSHFLELELKGYGMLDDKKWMEILDRGYKQTKSYLETTSIEN